MESTEITEELIRTHPQPIIPISEYVVDFQCKHGAGGLAQLPIGLRRAALVTDLDGMISNGGFRTYLGDRTADDDDQVDESVQSAIEALRACGATEAAEICATTLNRWETFVVATGDQLRQGERVDYAEIDAFCDAQDRCYYDQQPRMYSVLNENIRSHEREFISDCC